MHLPALCVLVRKELRPLADSILDGRIREAVSIADEIVAGTRPHEDASLSEIAQLRGDLMLALDRSSDAERSYRQAAALAVKESQRRELGRVLACRGTGLLNLHHYCFGAAAERFAQVINAKASSPAHKVEALCALALARHGLGQTGLAHAALDEAEQQAADAALPELAAVASLVRVDLAAQQLLRAHEKLNDHVFWRPPGPDGAATVDAASTLAQLDACLAGHGCHELVGRRLRHLRDLVLAADGDTSACTALQGHLDWLRLTGLGACEHQACIETVLAAAAAEDIGLACATMESLRLRSEASHPHWRIEQSYCEAKVLALADHLEESMRHYRRYVLESMQCIRAEVSGAAHFDPLRSACADAAQDDIGSRLPPKYREAYRYMLDNLGRCDLGLLEIAGHIGMSTRSLQAVFSNHLGMAPSEVMERCRFERIRADLLRDTGRSHTIGETALRWGVSCHSTLSARYRRLFHESPSETLARRDAGEIGA
jgi:AraC-like DNA-binding protein